MDMFSTKRLTILSLLLVGSAALPGCAADTSQPGSPLDDAERPHLPAEVARSRIERGVGGGPALTEEERAQVLGYLTRQGVDVSKAVFFAEDAILIEGDLLLDGQKLLRDSMGEEKKGYWFGSNPADENWNVEGENTVNVVWDTTAGTLDWGWAFAFYEAMQDWATHTNVNLTYSNPPNAVSILTVQTSHFGANSFGFMAWAEPGHDLWSPGRIYINLDFNGSWSAPGPCHVSSIFDLPYEAKRRVSLHELGHSVGFAHVGDAAWIPGTGVSDYESVMYAGGCDTPSALSSDDILSANTKYWTW